MRFIYAGSTPADYGLGAIPVIAATAPWLGPDAFSSELPIKPPH
jgi:hypothetical protein